MTLDLLPFRNGTVRVSPPIGERVGWAVTFLKEFETADEAFAYQRWLQAVAFAEREHDA